jgi:hypothetical protein
MHISFPPYMPHAPPISFLLISSLEHTDHETPHCSISVSPCCPVTWININSPNFQLATVCELFTVFLRKAIAYVDGSTKRRE